jgi:hypothetical protein
MKPDFDVSTRDGQMRLMAESMGIPYVTRPTRAPDGRVIETKTRVRKCFVPQLPLTATQALV